MRSFKNICSIVFVGGCLAAFGMESGGDQEASEGEKYFEMAEKKIKQHRTEALQYYELAYKLGAYSGASLMQLAASKLEEHFNQKCTLDDVIELLQKIRTVPSQQGKKTLVNINDCLLNNGNRLYGIVYRDEQGNEHYGENRLYLSRKFYEFVYLHLKTYPKLLSKKNRPLDGNQLFQIGLLKFDAYLLKGETKDLKEAADFFQKAKEAGLQNVKAEVAKIARTMRIVGKRDKQSSLEQKSSFYEELAKQPLDEDGLRAVNLKRDAGLLQNKEPNKKRRKIEKADGMKIAKTDSPWGHGARAHRTFIGEITDAIRLTNLYLLDKDIYCLESEQFTKLSKEEVLTQVRNTIEKLKRYLESKSHYDADSFTMPTEVTEAKEFLVKGLDLYMKSEDDTIKQNCDHAIVRELDPGFSIRLWDLDTGEEIRLPLGKKPNSIDSFLSPIGLEYSQSCTMGAPFKALDGTTEELRIEYDTQSREAGSVVEVSPKSLLDVVTIKKHKEITAEELEFLHNARILYSPEFDQDTKNRLRNQLLLNNNVDPYSISYTNPHALATEFFTNAMETLLNSSGSENEASIFQNLVYADLYGHQDAKAMIGLCYLLNFGVEEGDTKTAYHAFCKANDNNSTYGKLGMIMCLRNNLVEDFEGETGIVSANELWMTVHDMESVRVFLGILGKLDPSKIDVFKVYHS